MTPSHGPPAKILVVEDDVILNQSLVEILTFAHYDAVAAESGIEALHILRFDDTVPDLIVSDIVMREMDGHTLWRVVRSVSAMELYPVFIHHWRLPNPSHSDCPRRL